MENLKFDKPFLVQTLLGVTGAFALSKFSQLTHFGAAIQSITVLASATLQLFLQDNYKLEKGYYVLPFLGISAIGATFKTSWKTNLFSALAFTVLQFFSSGFRKNKEQIQGNQIQGNQKDKGPVTCNLTYTRDDAQKPKNSYIQLDISANTQQDKQNSQMNSAEFIFCIDISGSMDGPRIQNVKKVLKSLLTKMEEGLQANHNRQFFISLITYHTKAQRVQDRIQVTQQNIVSLRSIIDKISADGGTKIMSGLEEATNGIGWLRWFMSFFITVQSVNTCTSLIFLTDGDDNSFNQDEQKLRDLQKKWNERSYNLFAIGLSKDHKTEIMKKIVSDESQSLLPNALYQWVPDQPGTSTEGISLDEAVNAIFNQTISQNIQSITVKQISLPEIEMLNSNKTKEKSFELGGLSEGQKIQKFFYLNSEETELKRLKLEIAVKSSKGNTSTPIEIDLTQNEYDQAIHLAGLKQRITAMLKTLEGINDRDQKIKLTTPLKQEVDAFQTVSNDSDLKLLSGDLAKAIEGQKQDADAATRSVRFDRGRKDIDSD